MCAVVCIRLGKEASNQREHTSLGKRERSKRADKFEANTQVNGEEKL